MPESCEYQPQTESWPPSLQDLIAYAKHEMERLHYECSTIYGYTWAWKRLIKYAEREGCQGPLNDALITGWLEDEGYPAGQWPTPHPNRLQVLLRSLRILVHVQDCRTVLPGQVLASINRFSQADQLPAMRTVTLLGGSTGEARVAKLPPAFRDAYQVYEQDCRQRGFRPTTLLNAQRYLPRLLGYLVEHGVTEVGGHHCHAHLNFSHFAAGICPAHRGAL